MVCFHYPIPIRNILRDRLRCKCRNATLGPILMQSYYENYFKNYLISTNIDVKLGTVPICIGIGIGICSVGTVLHIITGRNEVGARLCFYNCLSFCSQMGCLPQCMLRYHTPPDQAPHLPDQAPPREQTPPLETATVADGTHPTGMHSSYISHLNRNRNRNRRRNRSRAVETHHKRCLNKP